MDCPIRYRFKKRKRKCSKGCNKKWNITRIRRKPKMNIIAHQGKRGLAGPPGPQGLPGTQGLPGPSGSRLLTSYQFVEIPDPMVAGGPAITTLTQPIAPATIGPEVQISNPFVTLSSVSASSRVVLRATIVWSFSFVSLAAPELSIASQAMRFSIFRDAPLVGVRVGTVSDTGSVTQINLEGSGTMLVNGVFTTTFEITDTGATGPSTNYFLTGAAGAASGFNVSMDGAPSIITNFNSPTVNEIHFSGEVIGPNVL
ncbi:hypothetical protein [Paenibacillus sp. FJAT-27812]|uniref:hypothetical protein n=1 Tax=Paenibacillus sp. FJAT-27812 TaxID=1684143 RepID=UPI0006A770EE|nr:hypothetical protein [Paenibacillus sp. FJAT-27812]